MYGFCLSFENNLNEKDYIHYTVWNSLSIGYNPMTRFEKDKLFFQNERIIVLLDGVIFNKLELVSRYKGKDWLDTFEKMYYENTSTFMDLLRGSFCGFVINKSTEDLIAFSNHTGEKPLYYMTDNKCCRYIFSHINFLEAELKKKEMKLKRNNEAAYQLLSCGSCLGNNTPFTNVYRITACKYIRVPKNKMVEEHMYHVFKNLPEWDLSMDECIKKGDELFRQAIKRIHDKNREYGYDTECDLSGGLDSRMAAFVAHEMGYEDILNVCYCVKGKIDHTTSKKIATDLGNRYSFFNMDGSILLDVDENINNVGAQVFYGVGTGSIRALKSIDTSNIGMCITGLLGELENAYWIKGEQHTAPSYIDKSIYYSRFLSFEADERYSKSYDNYEQMNIYELSFNLYCSSALSRQQICEVTSPFFDVDHIDFVFRIPLKYRRNYRFITSWMMQYYPKAAKYVWQTKKMPVDSWVSGEKYKENILLLILDHGKRICNGLFRRMHIPWRFYRIDDMNPFITWYYRDKKLRRFVNKYYDENIDKISDEKLKMDLHMMFMKGNPLDKIMVINYLGVNKRYLSL